jgi:hypothetical protein
MLTTIINKYFLYSSILYYKIGYFHSSINVSYGSQNAYNLLKLPIKEK